MTRVLWNCRARDTIRITPGTRHTEQATHPTQHLNLARLPIPQLPLELELLILRNPIQDIPLNLIQATHQLQIPILLNLTLTHQLPTPLTLPLAIRQLDSQIQPLTHQWAA